MPSALPFRPALSVSADLPSDFGLALVQVAGGDPAMLAQLKAMAWSAYLAAGSPEGPDERGMASWWSARMAGLRN